MYSILRTIAGKKNITSVTEKEETQSLANLNCKSDESRVLTVSKFLD